MTTPRDTLIEARELISDESRWTQNSYARDANDKPVTPYSTAACRWCAMGAIEYVGELSTDTDDAQIALSAAALKQFTMAPAAVNDRLGHHSVLAMFDTAIDKLTPEDEG